MRTLILGTTLYHHWLARLLARGEPAPPQWLAADECGLRRWAPDGATWEALTRPSLALDGVVMSHSLADCLRIAELPPWDRVYADVLPPATFVAASVASQAWQSGAGVEALPGLLESGSTALLRLWHLSLASLEQTQTPCLDLLRPPGLPAVDDPHLGLAALLGPDAASLLAAATGLVVPAGQAWDEAQGWYAAWQRGLSAQAAADLQALAQRLDPYGRFRRVALRHRLGPPPGLTVVHVPARSGSTRCPDKNILPVAGRPLLAWTVALARRLPGVDLVCIDTDSPEYAALAVEHGATCLGLRPPELAHERADPFAAVVHTLDLLLQAGHSVAKCISMYPTSPLRRASVMTRLLAELDHHEQVLSAFPVDLDPAWLALGRPPTLLAEALAQPLPSGAFAKTTGHFVGLNLRCGSRTVRYHFLTDPVELCDIDTADDLAQAEAILCAGFDFGVELP